MDDYSCRKVELEDRGLGNLENQLFVVFRCWLLVRVEIWYIKVSVFDSVEYILVDCNSPRGKREEDQVDARRRIFFKWFL